MLKTIQTALPKLELMRDLMPAARLVGQGSVGCVFVSGDIACKICIVEHESLAFYREVEMQEAFYPAAPKVLQFAVQKIGKLLYGCIVMERIDETLDVYLGRQLRIFELECILGQLQSLVDFAQSKNLVHGDLAFFNIGVRHSRGYPELLFIDFDDSATCLTFRNLDKLRIATECFLPSTGTAPMKTTNVDFVVEHLIRKWFPSKNPKQLNTLWKGMYTKFCNKKQ